MEIRFFKPEGQYGFLSNYFRWRLVVACQRWETVEHYYQAAKFSHLPELSERIRLLHGPDAAKSFARERTALWRADWLDVREPVMWEVLNAKFKHSAFLTAELLATNDARLVEASPYDDFWGMGSHGLGRNRLGEMLMLIRAQMRESASANLQSA